MLLKYSKRFLKGVKNKKLLALLLIVGYLCGIVLGVVFKGKTQTNIFIGFVENYHEFVFGLYSNPIKLSLIRLINNLFSFILIYLFCFSAYLFLFNLLIFLYRGIILGSVLTTFFNLFGIRGIIIYIFLVLVQNLLVSFALFFTSIIVYDLRSYCKKKYTDNVYLKYFLIGYVLTVAVVVLELLLLVLFFRPLNLYF